MPMPMHNFSSTRLAFAIHFATSNFLFFASIFSIGDLEEVDLDAK